MSTRGPFVCRSCLVSRTAQRRPTRPPWAATTATATTTTPTSTPTTTIAVRTLSRHTAAARGRLRRGDSRPSAASQRQPPLRATPVPRPDPIVEIPTLEDLQRASSNDPTHQYGRDEDVTVRFFDQQSDGTIRHVSNRSSIGDEAEAELAELEERLKETSTLMKDLEQRGGPTRRRTVRLRRKYAMIKAVEEEEALQTTADAAYEEADASETSGTSAVRIDDTGLSTNARRHVKNLNSVLRPAARRLENKNKTPSGGVDSKIITALWSRYGAARTGLAEAWSNIPPAVWSCLWEVLAWDDKKGSGVRNPRRMSHIYYLAKDMQAAGVPLTDEQQLLAMEAMFIEGWPAAALENWRRGAATLGARPATAAAYWELGVRMCSQQGDLDRAERAADRLFSDDLQDLLRQAASHGETIKRHGDPRVLFGLIRNAAAQGSKDKAWATYRRLRDLLDELEKQDGGMKIEDYDEVVSCFLTANHTEYAFDVFVDMMFSGALDLHQQQLQQQRTRPKKLPSAVANHFFFGKWLKRLIGAGDLDGAYRVLHFMQARGIMTASVQVNGLLGAWLRSGSAANQERADVLAWRMVESRRLFVDLRRREQQMDWPLKLRVGGFTKDEAAAAAAAAAATTDGADLTFVPRATLETFALMADNYKNRGQLAQLERLWEAFRACEMASTDAFMMNQLLESYVHEGRSDEARALYRDLVLGPQRIEPNAHTFLVLFKSLAVHRTVFRMMSDDDRRAAGADCRQLAADMVKLAPVAFKTETSAYASEIGKGSAQDTRSIAFYQALGRIVLHSFRKTGDYVGLCVMLRVLRPLFHSAAGGGARKDAAGDGFDRFLMTDSLAVELVAETSALERDTPTARHRIFKASEAVEVLLLEARQRQLRVYGWNEGEKEKSLHAGTDADLSDDLATVVAHVYRVKAATVSDKEFAGMYEMAVDELGVRKYL